MALPPFTDPPRSTRTEHASLPFAYAESAHPFPGTESPMVTALVAVRSAGLGALPGQLPSQEVELPEGTPSTVVVTVVHDQLAVAYTGFHEELWKQVAVPAEFQLELREQSVQTSLQSAT